MMNRKGLLKLIGVLVGIGLGFGLGYFRAVAGTVSQMPLLQPSRFTAVGFDREFDDFSRLGAMEYVAACGDRKSALRALESETQMLHGMQERNASDSTWLLRVAGARVIVRKAMAREQESPMNLQSDALKQESLSVEILLKGAGWRDPSESHMREVIRALDEDQCRK
jgi:hypothetical protein